MTYPTHNSRRPGQVWNRYPPDYNPEALPLEPVCSVLVYIVTKRCVSGSTVHISVAEHCYIQFSFVVLRASNYKAPAGSVSVKVINQCSFCKT